MKDLLDSGFRLSSFVSDIFGVTGRGDHLPPDHIFAAMYA